MPKLVLPNNVSFHTARHFLEANQPFEEDSGDALLVFRHRWAHLEPMALSMVILGTCAVVLHGEMFTLP